jgi:hypothetical protein
MQSSMVLILYLATLCFLAMVIFWQCLREEKPTEPWVTKVSFALKEGQTILGVKETPQGMDFYIGDYVRDEKYYDS